MKLNKHFFTSRYSSDTIEIGVKRQSINQSINQKSFNKKWWS